MKSIVKSIKNTFNRFSLDRKILTLIIIEVIGFLVVTLVAFSQVRTVGNEVKQVTYVILPLSVSIENIHSQIQSQRLNTEIVISNGNHSVNNKEISEAYLTARSNYSKGDKKLQNSLISTEQFIRKSVFKKDKNESVLSSHSEDLINGLSDLRHATQAYDRRVVNLLELVESFTFSLDMKILDKIASSETLLIEKLDHLKTELEKIRLESTKHAIYVERIAIGIIVLISLAAVVFFIAMVLIIIRMNISKPLQLLTDTINAFTALHKVEESEFEKALMERGDELGRMGRSFNRLKHDLWRQGQDLQTAKEEAERANRAKSMFLAAASHDLRQPLHAMQMYIAALRQKVSDRDALKIIDDVDAVSVSTARLLSALLDVSQLEAGAIKPHFEDFPVQEVLLRTFRSFAPVAKQKNLNFQLVASSAFVRSDPVLLERILGNFVSNAIRYTQQGRVLIGCRRQGNSISIEVWDTGCGFPDSQIQAIFEDFHQIDNKERDRGKGLGLGLAIARRLSQCLSHEIQCDSIVEHGSRFAVLVEAGKSQLKQVEKEELLENMARGLSNICVLLIEDDMEVLKATQQLLLSWGCKVYIGRNIDEVLRVVKELKATPPDIIVADNRLPGGAEGIEIATRVQLMMGRAIPTVIVTGDVEESHIRNIADQGYRVLCKPVQPAKLRALISHLVNPQTNRSSI